MLEKLIGAWRNRGFVGPRYEGPVGRLRFLWHRLVVRTDVVLVAERGEVRPPAPPRPELALQWAESWDAFAPWAAELDSAYHPGYAKKWREIFDWGERVALVLSGGRLAGFGWIQTGTPDGVACSYGRVFAGEFRVLRVGVLPDFRRQGINTWFYARLLEELFSRGATRVYVDCDEDNAPSLRAQIAAGFRPIGALRVAGLLFGGSASWWRTGKGLPGR